MGRLAVESYAVEDGFEVSGEEFTEECDFVEVRRHGIDI
jgi:hypothetical protein